MGFYVSTTVGGIHYRHCDEPLSVTIVDDAMKPLGAAFQPRGDDYDCAASLLTNLFALGYWRTDNLKIFDLRSGEELASFPFRRLETLNFDETGKKLLFKSASKVILLNIKKREPKQINGVLAIDRLVAMNGQNQMIAASQKKGELLRISLGTGMVSAIPLPIDATFFDLKQNPVTRQLVAIDRKKGIHCIDPCTWDVVWSVSLKEEIGSDHVGVGQFSGNGKLFGAAVVACNHNYTVVLDAERGRVTQRIDRVCYGLPWRHNLVRNDSTNPNSYVADALNLSTGSLVVARIASKGR